MVTDQQANRLVEKRDLIRLAALLLIASCIGVYLIVTTVIIAKDGVFCIEEARKFPDNSMSVIRATQPFGYPFLIFIANRFVSSFIESSSAYSWIYPAQGVSLLCRVLSLIALYFIGKLLVGSRKSFWAILILIILPYPARFGSDALRDWPSVLFLAWGFLFLLLGAERRSRWMFGAAGLAAGLGHMIRPECAQLVVYGVLWLLIELILHRRRMDRTRAVLALFFLLIAFAIPIAPYMQARGRILPRKLKRFISPRDQTEVETIGDPNVNSYNQVRTSSYLPGDLVKAMGRLVGEVSDNLAHFFLPALLVGIYLRFRKGAASETEMFFVPALIAVNVIMMILLYCNYGYISRRHCLPLVVFPIFYVPAGLEFIGDRVAMLVSKICARTHLSEHSSRYAFSTLLIIGAAVCMPKLLKPIRADKQGYIVATQWIKENTAEEAYIATPDRRISFYAERRGLVYKKEIPEEARYIVRISRDENEAPNIGRGVRKEYSVQVDRRKSDGKRIVVYRVL
ncbi:MAG: glycosyltransferase family 39 protein [Planctomycetota bacterium]|jgi:hypothetical protein